jgi:hypothetical protein
VSSREITVRAPSADDAIALIDTLEGYRAALAKDEGRWALRIARDRGRDELLCELLERIDLWLAARGIEQTEVVLEDGKTYVVPAPLAGSPARS